MHARSPRGARALADALGLIAAVLLALPVIVGAAYALAAALGLVGTGAAGLSLARVERVLRAHETWAGLGFTLWVAAAATLLATAGAVLLAVLFRGSSRADRIGRGLAAVPLPVPHLVAALLGVWVLGQSGLLARLLAAVRLIDQPAQMPALIYDRAGAGLILALAWKELAFLAIVANALLATRGAAAEEAARTLGASPWQTFRRVSWPVLWRGLAPAAVAVFVFVAGNYEAAALLAPSDPVALPLLIADRAADPDLARRGDAYVVSLLLLDIAIAAVAAHEWMRSRWEPLTS